ncbi:hypothetical protein K6W16_06550 [Burkholderia dolosa]|uniref:Uncharacterized protein n=1 Tax=Burkholderia dolosa TaxID=152500 RepID=A0A892IER0_9BURK|nr:MULTISPECIES: hypothetical protein [Burkholderia]MBR8417995.1 hypothetical protein [Burkholderia dolosa]MBY4658978.1 hypothetical protein [Burkholderia dolosa]MBY4689551.1 hypothetical protein [Burkholderia dolosa]MBY4782719.1 hypothetical protein [Burkholderia dolosa]MBY4789083.1 hypothetical protein [Burkholderia dolosa]
MRLRHDERHSAASLGSTDCHSDTGLGSRAARDKHAHLRVLQRSHRIHRPVLPQRACSVYATGIRPVHRAKDEQRDFVHRNASPIADAHIRNVTARSRERIVTPVHAYTHDQPPAFNRSAIVSMEIGLHRS